MSRSIPPFDVLPSVFLDVRAALAGL